MKVCSYWRFVTNFLHLQLLLTEHLSDSSLCSWVWMAPLEEPVTLPCLSLQSHVAHNSREKGVFTRPGRSAWLPPSETLAQLSCFVGLHSMSVCPDRICVCILHNFIFMEFNDIPVFRPLIRTPYGWYDRSRLPVSNDDRSGKNV